MTIILQSILSAVVGAIICAIFFGVWFILDKQKFSSKSIGWWNLMDGLSLWGAILLGVIIGVIFGAILGLFIGLVVGSLNIADFYKGAIIGIVVSEILIFAMIKFISGEDWMDLLSIIFFQKIETFIKISLFLLIPAISVGVIATKITPVVKSWFS